MHIHEEDRCSITVPQPFAFTELVHGIRNEFHDLPGMRLTLEQAVRLFGKDREATGRALDQLIAQHELARDRFGRYKVCGK